MAADTGAHPPSKSAAKNKKRKNKKKAEKNANNNGEITEPKNEPDDDADDAEGDAGEDDEDVGPSRNASVVESSTNHAPVSEEKEEAKDGAKDEETNELPIRNGSNESAAETSTDTSASIPAAQSQTDAPEEATPQPIQSTQPAQSAQEDSDTIARLDAMAKERDSLQAEVAELRKSLQDIQSKHEEELSNVREEVDEIQAGKERAEEQYRTLLGKVNTIRSQLGERLKADAEELSLARSQIEELQEKQKELQAKHDEKESTIRDMSRQVKTHNDELTELRNRSNLSTSNWSKERDEYNSQLAFAREEFESAKQAMQDWEVLAMEERSLRENLSERVGELDDQLTTLREAYERVSSERDGQNTTVDGLQRALHDLQEARKQELREMVENSQSQLDALRKQADESAQKAAESANKLEATQKELERYIPFEREVKEKNLLLGKLRHEAVILNDHLTKALRFLKKGRPEDNVDRQIVTNHFLHFLALDRSDPKKFQILQLIAALLGWTEEQREQAGLARPGASNAQLRVPLSPFRRTPSTPGLTSDFVTSPTGSSRESLAELWSDFLEREAEESAGGRRGSSVVGQRSASVTSPPPRQDQPGLGIRAVSSGQMNPPQKLTEES
ncbi:hypothetical protein MBLNU457_3366t1 [Dothideomycetes sp. NU457]